MHRVKVVVLLVISVVIGLALIMVISHASQPFSPARPVETMPTLPPTPVPSASPTAPRQTSTAWTTPDGSKTLVMKTLVETSGTATYSFSVTSKLDQTEKFIFKKTVGPGNSITIPFNTWSPDNKYFFIQEHSATGADALVFKATGEAFSASEPFLDITPLFDQKNSGYTLGEVTGWAAPTLLIVNTKVPNTGALGPSFWFDISRKSLIRLATSFQ